MKFPISMAVLLHLWQQHHGATATNTVKASTTLRGSSSSSSSLTAMMMCPNSPQDAVDLVLVNNNKLGNHHHPGDATTIGKVWITNHHQSGRDVVGKTCIHVDLDTLSSSSSSQGKSLMIQSVDIYHKCQPPSLPSSIEKFEQEDEYDYHLEDDPYFLTSSSQWCFDTLECNTDKDVTTTTSTSTSTEGYVALRAEIMEIESTSIFLQEEHEIIQKQINQQKHQQEKDNMDMEYATLPFLLEDKKDRYLQTTVTEEDCAPFGVADQDAIDAELAKYADETPLGVVYRALSGRDDSFFTVNGLLNQTGYRGWCVDSDHPMCISCTYNFDVCSSYRDDFSRIEGDGGIDRVANLPNVNWLINNYAVGTPLSTTDSLCPVDSSSITEVTWNLFQAVVWKLIDNGYHRVISCQNNNCEDAADALAACAIQYGQDYKPLCCNETIGVLLIWDDDVTGELSKQELLVEVPLVDIDGVCEEEVPPETDAPRAPPGDPCYDTTIDVDAIEAAIQPWADEALMTIKYRGVADARPDSYFTVGGLLDLENLVAWCLDIDQDACLDCEWEMDSISTYDEEALIDLVSVSSEGNLPVNLTNFNEVNFVINEFAVGTPFLDNPHCDFDYDDFFQEDAVVTWQMMQRVMWELADHGNDSILNCRDNRECGIAAMQLVDCALTAGADYIPNCCPHNKVGIMILKDDPDTGLRDAQELLVEIPLRHIPGVCPEEFADNFEDDDGSGRFLITDEEEMAEEEEGPLSFTSDATSRKVSSTYAMPSCRVV